MSPHVLGDGGLTHRDSQLQQLPVDSRRTPEGIGGGELTDQRADLQRDPWTPGALSALPGPKQTKAATMPANDRLRPDEVKSRAPVGPCLRKPRHSIRSAAVKRRRGRRDRFTTAS